MFKFNFTNEVDEVESQTKSATEEKDKEIECYHCKEIGIPDNIIDMIENISRDQIIKVDYGYGVTISCLSAKEVMNMLKEKSDNEQFLDVLKADGQHSDLLPGKYEGGLKTWECTKDLAVYFAENKLKNLNGKLQGKTVLDLGCGSGILGILCLLLGAKVSFQDYNQEVLESMTIPNIFLNSDESVKSRVKLYSGDWSSFLELITQNIEKKDTTESGKFDYILTSETIYNPENYRKIINIIKELLKKDGSAFVAAKAHYFGVGGTLREFETQLRENNLDSTVCWETTEGVAREILEVKLKCESVNSKGKN